MSVRSYRRVSTSLSPALFGLAFLAAGCGETATAGDTCDGGACNPPPAERDISIGIDPPRQDLGVPPTTPEGDGGVETDALLLIDGSLPPDAFRPPATCETRNDGVCDEPSSGGVCPAGTDPEDCRERCETAADCPPGEFCRDGACVPSDDQGCTRDDDCDADEHCDLASGECVAETPPGGCMRSADCGPGEVCNLQTNTCMAAAGGECEIDADCGLRDVCRDGACVPVGGGEAGHACDGPAQCPEGICITEAESAGQLPGGLCAADCLDDADCNGGLCALLDANFGIFGCIAACRRSEDCRADWVCYPDPAAPSPYCVPDCRLVGCGGAACDAATGLCDGGGGGGGPDSCRFAFDGFCDEPLGCEPGTDTTDCEGGGGDFCPYTNDGECDEPFLCAPGTDAADCGGGGGCMADVDCAAGQICRNGACVADPAADGSEGSRCGPNGPFCDGGLRCYGSNGGGTCRTPCNANANEGAGDCGRAEICVALEACDPVFAQCDGFCFPDDGCVPGDTARSCGVPAYCDIIGPAAACIAPGPGAVGDACAPPGALGCREGLACYAGRCAETCGADAVCPDAQTCVDFGEDRRLCLDACDPFDAASCGALVPCAAVDTLPTGTLGLCFPNLREPRGVAGDDCEPGAADYWGTCNAAHACAPADPEQAWRGDVCQALCDADHQAQCPEGSVCMGGLGPTSGTGLCFGECDPAASPSTCPAGGSCKPRRVGLLGDREVLAGECLARVGDNAVYEDCFGLEGECVPGALCAEEIQFRRRCLPLCDGAAGAHPCPEGSTCTPGRIDGLDDAAETTQWGVCVRDDAPL